MGKQLSVEQCSFYIQVICRKITRIMCIIRMQNEKKVVFREEIGKNISCFRDIIH